MLSLLKYKPVDEDETYTFKKVKKSEDYSEWHDQICLASGIVDNRYPVKGMRVWKPYGFKMMELIHEEFQNMAEDEGGQRAYFPLIIPYKYAKMNESWWEQFETEGYHACKKTEEGDYKGVGLLRPTGEPAMYPMISLWLRSKNDLPLRIFQICQNYRNESVTKSLLRPREFWWMEYHCAFSTKEEVVKEAEEHLRMVKELGEFIGVPVLTVSKPRWEVFPGGIMSYENYIVMPDGKTVDAGSVNNLGQAYAEKFNVTFTTEDRGEEYPWIVCTGYATRWLAGVLGYHGDDKGLVLPPSIAPVQVMIVPINSSDGSDEVKFSKKIMGNLEDAGVRVDVDDRSKSVGKKFFDWEIKGVPVRLEVGGNEVKGGFVSLIERDTGEKRKVNVEDLNKTVNEVLTSIRTRLYEKGKEELESKIEHVQELSEVMKVVNNKGVASMHWCESRECYDEIMKLGEGEGLDAFGTKPEKVEEGKCIACGDNTKTLLYAANTY